MAKITFTAKDMSRMQKADKGWHLFEVISVSSAATKKQDDIRHTLSFRILESGVDDKNIGKEMETGWNTKYPGFMAEFLAAAWNITIDELVEKLTETPDVDFEDLIGVKVWNEVIDEMYNDKPIRKMGDNWMAATSKPPF